MLDRLIEAFNNHAGTIANGTLSGAVLGLGALWNDLTGNANAPPFPVLPPQNNGTLVFPPNLPIGLWWIKDHADMMSAPNGHARTNQYLHAGSCVMGPFSTDATAIDRWMPVFVNGQINTYIRAQNAIQIGTRTTSNANCDAVITAGVAPVGQPSVLPPQPDTSPRHNEIFIADGDVQIRSRPSRFEDAAIMGIIPDGSRLQAFLNPHGIPEVRNGYMRVLAHQPGGQIQNGWIRAENLRAAPASMTERDLSAPIGQPPRERSLLRPTP